MSFVNIALTTGTPELVTEGLERLTALMEAKGYVGWKPQPADITTILIEALGPQAADVAGVAAAMPEAAFRNFGEKLEGVPFNEGASATCTSLWTLLAEGGEYKAHTIPQGTQVAIGNFGFYVDSAVQVKAGESSAKVHLTAIERGAEYNKLTGPAELVESINWVKEVTIEGETTGGAGEESDEEYINRLVARQAIRAEVPITANDYATFARNVPSTILPSGVVVGRATSVDGYDPETTTFTGTVTSASAEVTVISSFTGISVGSELEGTGIPAGTTVTALHSIESKLTMSAKATASGTGESIKAVGSYENERTDCVFVTGPEGQALSSEAMTKIETWLREHRELNFLVYVRAPSYNAIYVTTQIHVLPGYEATGVAASVKAALEGFLSPETWANPNRHETGSNAWLNKVQGYNVVRYNQLVGVIESVPGVQYVFAGAEGLKIGKSASPTETLDITMIGPAPLPSAKTITVTTQ